MAIAIMIVAYAFILVGGIMMLIEAFRESILWGIACLLLPVVSLFFLIVHWNVAKKGFFVQLIGLAVLVLAALVAPGSHRWSR